MFFVFFVFHTHQIRYCVDVASDRHTYEKRGHPLLLISILTRSPILLVVKKAAHVCCSGPLGACAHLQSSEEVTL